MCKRRRHSTNASSLLWSPKVEGGGDSRTTIVDTTIERKKEKVGRGECIDFIAGATYIVGLIVGTCHSRLAAQEVENNGHPDSDPQRKAVSSLPALGRAVGAAQVRFYSLKLD